RFSRDWSSDVCSSDLGCRFFLFFLFSLVIVLTSAPAVDASIELRIDGETVPARSALALLGTGLGIASDVLRAELGVLVDDADFRSEERRVGEECRSRG